MFSGIIEAVTPIRSVADMSGVRRLRIGKPRTWKLVRGQSIAVDGICSTVVATGRGYFDVEYMPATLLRTTASHFSAERVVNLERSLTLSSYVDGHLVQGHVDASVRVARVTSGESLMLTIELPRALRPFVPPQGSIAINGVSLTVAARSSNSCTVAIIPFTEKRTNLGALRKGDMVNLEIDLIARYLAALRNSDTVARNAKKRIRGKK